MDGFGAGVGPRETLSAECRKSGCGGRDHTPRHMNVGRQMKKSKSEHALALVKAGLSGIPVVGGSIASLVGDYVPTATQKSQDRASELLRSRLEELDDRIDLEAVDRQEFAELFKSCYLSIVRSHREEKLRAATAILANLLLREGDPDKCSYTELDHFSRCVETLSSGAVEVLGVFVRDPEPKLDRTMDSYRLNFGRVQALFPQYSPDLLMGLIAELDRANLLHRGSASGIETSNYENIPVGITPPGTRFARFLLE